MTQKHGTSAWQKRIGKICPPLRRYFWQNRIGFWQKEMVAPPLKNAPGTPMRGKIKFHKKNFKCHFCVLSYYIILIKLNWIELWPTISWRWQQSPELASPKIHHYFILIAINYCSIFLQSVNKRLEVQCWAAWADLHKHVEDAEVEQSAGHAKVRGQRPPLNIGDSFN